MGLSMITTSKAGWQGTCKTLKSKSKEERLNMNQAMKMARIKLTPTLKIFAN